MESGISIIVPVYNVEKYLKKCLDSIFNQSFKDFNLIIVNDGSTDNSEKIINEYLEKYINIIYIKQENLGVSEARNVGLRKANKKYTMFIDSDDYIEKDTLESLYNKAENTNADMVIYGHENFYDDSSKIKSNDFKWDENKIYSNIEVMEMMLEYKILGYSHCKMYLSENIINKKMYFEKGRIIEDLFPVFKQVSLSKRIVFINKKMYKYRQRQSSLTHNLSIKDIDDYKYAASMVYNYSKKFNQIKDNSQYTFLVAAEGRQLRNYMSLNIKCDKKIYKECEIEKVKLLNIIFNKDISNKVKLKLLLFNFNILHLYLKRRYSD